MSVGLVEPYDEAFGLSGGRKTVLGESSSSSRSAASGRLMTAQASAFNSAGARDPYERRPGVAQSSPRQPLRAVAVGPCLVRGGAEQWLINLARFVNPRRLQLLKVIVTDPNMIDDEFVADLPIPYEIGRSEVIQRSVPESDVLIGWGLGLDEYLGDVRPKLCVYVAHGEGEWTRRRLRESLGSIDHVVAVSQRVADAVGPSRSTTVIHNGVDSNRLGQSRSRGAVRTALGFAPEDFVLGYVGRFSGEKNVERIVLAAVELPRNYKVLLVGWGRMRDDLLDLANERIPGRFAFASAAHYMGDYYQAMDAFCLVSREEGYSLALLEAMMCGRPVIVTPVGSVPEIIIDRVNGLVVSGDPTSIARAARLLQAHPEWARAVALEARAYAEEHGHSARMALRYEELLESLWDGKNSPASH